MVPLEKINEKYNLNINQKKVATPSTTNLWILRLKLTVAKFEFYAVAPSSLGKEWMQLRVAYSYSNLRGYY